MEDMVRMNALLICILLTQFVQDVRRFEANRRTGVRSWGQRAHFGPRGPPLIKESLCYVLFKYPN